MRYERISPFTEANGHLVNLYVPPDFTAAVPVQSGGTGPFTGPFPEALLDTDGNNVAPRLGAAYRLKPGLIIRGGYGVSYNSGSYSTIARQLASQPPFAESDTVLGSALVPLQITNAFGGSTANQTTNNYGVAKDYALGRVQTWNADVSKDLRQAWNVGAGYTRTTGASLDMVRTPNRGPLGLRIEDVQAFNWQTAEGISVLNAGTFRVQRRMVKGIGGSVTYAGQVDGQRVEHGGGQPWSRRTIDLAVARLELIVATRSRPIPSSAVWTEQALAAQRRRTAAVLGAGAVGQLHLAIGHAVHPARHQRATDVSRGTNGTLRPTTTATIRWPTRRSRLFNTSAFDSAGRNVRQRAEEPDHGPAAGCQRAVRDVRMHGNRALTIQATASNILNMVNYASIDTPSTADVRPGPVGLPMRSAQLIFRFRSYARSSSRSWWRSSPRPFLHGRADAAHRARSSAPTRSWCPSTPSCATARTVVRGLTAADPRCSRRKPQEIRSFVRGDQRPPEGVESAELLAAHRRR